jgi:hypothetical protein
MPLGWHHGPSLLEGEQAASRVICHNMVMIVVGTSFSFLPVFDGGVNGGNSGELVANLV